MSFVVDNIRFESRSPNPPTQRVSTDHYKNRYLDLNLNLSFDLDIDFPFLVFVLNLNLNLRLLSLSLSVNLIK